MLHEVLVPGMPTGSAGEIPGIPPVIRALYTYIYKTKGKGTTDAIFIVRQVQEKLLGKQKELWMAFVDLEKAFDRVPREVLWWALRHVGVEEWINGKCD